MGGRLALQPADVRCFAGILLLIIRDDQISASIVLILLSGFRSGAPISILRFDSVNHSIFSDRSRST